MIYIIGGAPRCGKTKLANKLSKKLRIKVFSTDLLRIKILKNTPTKVIYDQFPFEKMFNGDRVDDCLRQYKPIDFLNADKREANTIFYQLRKLIRSKIDSRQDCIIEGVHLLPEYITKFGLSAENSMIIYLGKISTIKILHGLNLNKDKNDWIIGHINKNISLKRAALMVSVYGKYFKNEAEKYNFKFINTETNFLKIINNIVNYLCNNKQK